MGNSAAYRIHTCDDVHEAHDMARRLLALAETRCGCAQTVVAEAETVTHAALDRYLALDAVWMAISVPADLFAETAETLAPHLGARGRPARDRDGGAYLRTDLTPAVIAALRGLPPMAAEIRTRKLPAAGDLPEAFLAVAGRDRASISWDVCWPGNHSRGGFEIGVNGMELWHPQPPAGHSVYVHVSPERPEHAHELAAAVGGRVIGEPAAGW